MIDTVLAPPGRREANRRSRREAILDVAQASFVEEGYAGTSMSGIAAQLGGSKGTLWSYFPSKELLFAAVVERATDEFQRQLMVILNPDDDLETALRRFCSEFLAKLISVEAIALHRLVLGEIRRFPELGRIFYERGPRQTHVLLAGFIAEVQARGHLLGIEPIRAAQQLTGLCQSGHHQMLLTGVIAGVSPAECDEDVDAAMTTFMHAYGSAASGAPGRRA